MIVTSPQHSLPCNFPEDFIDAFYLLDHFSILRLEWQVLLVDQLDTLCNHFNIFGGIIIAFNLYVHVVHVLYIVYCVRLVPRNGFSHVFLEFLPYFFWFFSVPNHSWISWCNTAVLSNRAVPLEIAMSSDIAFPSVDGNVRPFSILLIRVAKGFNF